MATNSNVSSAIRSAARSAPRSSVLTVNSVGVTTLAGWPDAPGAIDATGSAARFGFIGSVRTDAAGNVYAADVDNDTIRKISPAGVVTTFAGAAGIPGSTDGPTGTARFNTPGGVAVDSSGNLYVADSFNYTIRKITPGGMVSTLAGQAGLNEGTTDGTGSAARFYDPEDLAVDSSGNVWVADGKGDTIRLITPAGVVTTVAGSPRVNGTANGTGSSARFNNLLGIIVDLAGNVYVADSDNNTIRKMTPAFAVTTLAGTSGRSGGTDGTGSAARFSAPGGMAVDPSGILFVADSGNNTIREITPSGVVTTIAGLAGATEATDGLGLAARFNGPTEVAIDSAGILYVADGDNYTVRRFVTGGLVPPLILSQPSASAVTAGQTATFTVAASGSLPLTYQWQELPPGNTAWSNLSDNATFSGSATATLTITGATSLLDGSPVSMRGPEQRRQRHVSAAVTLSVAGAPVVFALSPSQSVAPGGSVTLSVTAGGEGLSLPVAPQWDRPSRSHRFDPFPEQFRRGERRHLFGPDFQFFRHADPKRRDAHAFQCAPDQSLRPGVRGNRRQRARDGIRGRRHRHQTSAAPRRRARPRARALQLKRRSRPAVADALQFLGLRRCDQQRLGRRGDALAADFTAVGAFPFATDSDDTASCSRSPPARIPRRSAASATRPESRSARFTTPIRERPPPG